VRKTSIARVVGYAAFALAPATAAQRLICLAGQPMNFDNPLLRRKSMRHASHNVWLGLGAIAAICFAAAAPAAQLTKMEEANKQVVLDFYAALNKADDTGSMKQSAQGIGEKYLSPNYTQHSPAWKNMPGTGTHREKLIRMFQSQPARPVNTPPMGPQKLESIMADGDLVMMLLSRTRTDPATGKAGDPNYIFNMFRVRDGKLTDHWDVSPGAGGVPAPGAGAPPGAGGPPPGAGGPPPGVAPR
jgi:predicted SnoaL-like aldol condensation-catalyzing enzyme